MTSEPAPAAEFSLDELLRRPQQLAELPPCQAGCPSGADIRRWIGLVAQRNKLGLTLDEACRRAFAVVTDKNPFPATMGRICPHPCESGCNRSEKDGAVAVHALERFLGDWALEHGLELERLAAAVPEPSVGVVGAGPAGLSFAYQMARRGYRVTVYERGGRPGGMLLRGIPEYRLPEHVLMAEIDRILRLGVELVLECPIHQPSTLDELRRAHAAIFLGVGAQRGRALGVPGGDGAGVLTGVDYLRAVNGDRAPHLGRRIAVVGGGNTAIDAARAARRQGTEVTIVYRRSRAEMPASASEIDDALAEDVRLELLAAPLEVLRDGAGAVRALRLQRMRLGEPDGSGRRRPEPAPGEELELAVDAVLAAVSQEVDRDGLDALPAAHGFLAAAERGALGDGLWSGGDAVGLGIATLAIAQGRMAAEAVDARLRGLAPPAAEARAPMRAGAVKLDLYASRERTAPPVRAPAERLAEPDLEVQGTIDAAGFVDEASRCLSCGSCFGCAQCAMYCNPGGFSRLDEVAPGAYFALDLGLCEGCGKCLEVCPCGFLHRR
ncbi:MAG TPA: FAD-dependent oxidoreductase [Thermoanaerobaculia bacterium]